MLHDGKLVRRGRPDDQGLLLLRSVHAQRLRREHPAPATPSNAAKGIATGDVDNDGDTDLVVANDGGPILYLNNGTGRLRAGGLSLFDGGAADATAVKLSDVNSDTFLDLIVVNGDGTATKSS